MFRNVGRVLRSVGILMLSVSRILHNLLSVGRVLHYVGSM